MKSRLLLLLCKVNCSKFGHDSDYFLLEIFAHVVFDTGFMLICFRFFLEFDFAKHESNAETPVLLVLLVPVLELWTSMSGPAPRLGPRGHVVISFLIAVLYLFHAAFCIFFIIFQDLSLGLHRKLRNLNFYSVIWLVRHLDRYLDDGR